MTRYIRVIFLTCLSIIILTLAVANREFVDIRILPSELEGFFGSGMIFSIPIFVLFLLPWIDRCKVKSFRYRSPTYKYLLASFVVSFIGLGVIGMNPATPILTWVGRFFTLVYFGFFVALYFLSPSEQTSKIPKRVVMHE